VLLPLLLDNLLDHAPPPPQAVSLALLARDETTLSPQAEQTVVISPVSCTETGISPQTVATMTLALSSALLTQMEVGVELMATNIGDSEALDVTFTTLLNTVVDPTTVAVRVENPAGTITTYTYPTDIQKLSTGKYRMIVPITAAGTWNYNWVSTGTANGSEFGSFFVAKDAF
jgi:hypothetical protein